MRTTAFPAEQPPALSALISGESVLHELPYGKHYVCHEQDVAYIIERGDGEQHIVKGTYRPHSAEVQHCLVPRQRASYVVDDGYSDKHYRPHGAEKEA